MMGVVPVQAGGMGRGDLVLVQVAVSRPNGDKHVVDRRVDVQAVCMDISCVRAVNSVMPVGRSRRLGP